MEKHVHVVEWHSRLDSREYPFRRLPFGTEAAARRWIAAQRADISAHQRWEYHHWKYDLERCSETFEICSMTSR